MHRYREIDTTLRELVEEAYRERGGKTPSLPGMGAVSGPRRVDVRFAEDNDGELYLLTRADGVMRKVVGARQTTAPMPAATVTRGLPPTMMAGYDGRIPDRDIWSIVHYLRTLAQGK